MRKLISCHTCMPCCCDSCELSPAHLSFCDALANQSVTWSIALAMLLPERHLDVSYCWVFCWDNIYLAHAFCFGACDKLHFKVVKNKHACSDGHSKRARGSFVLSWRLAPIRVKLPRIDSLYTYTFMHRLCTSAHCYTQVSFR